MKVNKSYNYYYCLIPTKIFDRLNFFNTPYFDYIFNYYSSFPIYIEQGICDILPNKSGILFTQQVLQQFDPYQIMNDFTSCFVFNLPTEICNKEQSRYRKNFTFDFDIIELNKEIPMDLILQYEESPWKPILEIDADFFYLRNDNEVLLGSKDYKQLENWLIEVKK